MARARKTKVKDAVSTEELGPFERRLIAASPAFQTHDFDIGAFMQAFAPPSTAYPGTLSAHDSDLAPNAERDWLIRVLDVLIQCYPHPVNMALDCLRTSLIEVNRGLTPKIFRPHKPAKGGKSNFEAQEAMNLAVLAADYLHKNAGNDDAYRQELADAKTSALEIESWRARIDLAYRDHAITAWKDKKGARNVLSSSVASAKKAIGRRRKPPRDA